MSNYNNSITNKNDGDLLLNNSIIYSIFYKQKHKEVKHSTSKTKELRLNSINTVNRVNSISKVIIILCLVGFVLSLVITMYNREVGFPIKTLIPFVINIPFVLLKALAVDFITVSEFILSDSEKEELKNKNHPNTTRLIKCEYCKSKIFEDSQTCEVCGARL